MARQRSCESCQDDPKCDCMFDRPYWIDRIETAWQRRSVVWLVGVRRVGKTVLCRSLPEVEYLDCELPSVRRSLDHPESFLRSVRGRRVVLGRDPPVAGPVGALEDRRRPFPGRAGRRHRLVHPAGHREVPRCAHRTQGGGLADAHDRDLLGRAPPARWSIGSPVAACRLPSWRGSPSETSRIGSTATGRRTSRSCSAWSGEPRSRDSSSSC